MIRVRSLWPAGTAPVSALLGLMLIALPGIASAQTTPAAAISFPAGTLSSGDFFEDIAPDFSVSSYVLGWQFTVNQPITVTELGWFVDPTIGTLTDRHSVGLYLFNSPTSSLLGSTTVTPADTIRDAFAYNPLSSNIVLTPGNNYVIAGVTGSKDPFVFDIAINTDSAINYLQDQIDVGGTLTFPSDSDVRSGVDPAYFGPNFGFTNGTPSVNAPEPTSGALLLAAILPLGTLTLASRSRRPRS